MIERDNLGVSPVDRDTDDDESTAEIRANIEQTRAEMGNTIEAIQARLSPDNIKESVKEQINEQLDEAKAAVREATIGKVEHMVQRASDTVYETRMTMMDTIRENPIPTALVGIGLGWLFMNGGRKPVRYSGRGAPRNMNEGYQARYSTTDRYDSRYNNNQPRYNTGYASNYGQQGTGMMEQGQRVVGNAVDRVQDTASNVAGRVQDTASNVADRVQDTASNVAGRVQDTASNVADRASDLVDEAQYQAKRVEDRFRRSLYENPLAVGAVALAVGAAVGMVIPETRAEHELMGDVRDNLVDKVQDVAQQTIGKVQDTVQNVTEQARETVQNVADQAHDKVQGMAREQGR